MAFNEGESKPFLGKLEDTRETIKAITELETPNFAYIFTTGGILNVFQLLGSIICTATTLYHCQPKYKGKYGSFIGNYSELFFLLTNFGCITSVTLMFLCNTASLKACLDTGRTIAGIIFNGGLCVLNIISTYFMFQSIETQLKEIYSNIDYTWKMAVSIIGLINAFVYALGVVDSYKSNLREAAKKFPLNNRWKTIG